MKVYSSRLSPSLSILFVLEKWNLDIPEAHARDQSEHRTLLIERRHGLHRLLA